MGRWTIVTIFKQYLVSFPWRASFPWTLSYFTLCGLQTCHSFCPVWPWSPPILLSWLTARPPEFRNLSPCFSFPQVPQKRCHCVLAIGTFVSLGLRFLCVTVLQSAQQHGHLVCWNRRSVETHTRFIPLSVNWVHSWILSSLPSITLSEVRLGSYVASAVFVFI